MHRFEPARAMAHTFELPFLERAEELDRRARARRLHAGVGSVGTVPVNPPVAITLQYGNPACLHQVLEQAVRGELPPRNCVQQTVVYPRNPPLGYLAPLVPGRKYVYSDMMNIHVGTYLEELSTGSLVFVNVFRFDMDGFGNPVFIGVEEVHQPFSFSPFEQVFESVAEMRAVEVRLRREQIYFGRALRSGFPESVGEGLIQDLLTRGYISTTVPPEPLLTRPLYPAPPPLPHRRRRLMQRSPSGRLRRARR